VINDEEDDNEDGVLMDTPIGPEAVLIGTSAVPQLAQDADDAQFAQDADDDALCFHCTECNLTLASSNNFKRHQQSKRHQNKVEARKAVSSSEQHCDVCNAFFKAELIDESRETVEF
jgi:hypothetical protein